MYNFKKKRVKQYGIITIFILLFSSFIGCNKELEDLNGETLIIQRELAGSYKVQITPKLLGLAAVTTGEHDAELIHEGGDVLRLKYTGFRREPMPFEMSVDILMRIKPSVNNELSVENIGGDFDADIPEGQSVIDPDDAPPGIEIPEDALINGLHSNGKSSITGKYQLMDNPDGTQAMNFNWELHPNVGVPVIVSIRTNKKIK
ncbi:MAG: hypothetical protein ACK5H1_06915 [Tenacibaculum sp.]